MSFVLVEDLKVGINLVLDGLSEMSGAPMSETCTCSLCMLLFLKLF